MSILNTGFGDLSDTDFLQKGREIVNALSTPPGSGFFGGVTPTPATLTAALDAFEATLLLGNAPGAASDREAAREAADTLMGLIAAGLENITTERAVLVHSGYDLRKINERDTTPTAKPENLRVKPTGIPGEAKLDCSGVPNVLTYEMQWTLDPNAGPWNAAGIVPSIRAMLIEGLQRGKDTWFRVRAYGPNGAGPWSDPATMMVV